MINNIDDYRYVVSDIFDESISAIQKASSYDKVSKILKAAHEIYEAINRNGNKIIIFGNGGSAADAQHMAAEFVGRFEINRDPLPALALTADTSVISALSNDFGFDQIFERQILAIGIPGDVAIGISTSGNSLNVIKGLSMAEDSGICTIGMTGNDGGEIGKMVDIHLNVPRYNTARIQEMHAIICHIICSLVEEMLVEC